MSEILPIDLYTTSEIREIERFAFARIAPGELMDRAGKAAYAFLLENWPLTERIVVVCGSGNNGGDGYVLAKYAHEGGIIVEILALGEPRTDEARSAAAQVKTLIKKEVHYGVADVIVDAYLGIGLNGDKLTKGAAEVITDINITGVPIFSLDCPSGLNTDTGAALGMAVKAEATLTFIGLKRGLFTGDGVENAGRIACHSLGLSADYFQSIQPETRLYLVDAQDPLLPRRERGAHKGDYGHVLVIGGNKGYGGAVIMAAEAALRTGAGLVSVATQPEHISAVLAERPEIMAHGMKTSQELEPLLAKATMTVLGPGLGLDAWGKGLFETAIKTEKPLLLDADALTLLAETDLRRQDWILTPHPGEAGRLLGKKSKDIQKDRFEAVQELQRKYGGTIVLKGAGSLIAGESGEITLCPYGNPGMASGGMGDVLSGIIGGLAAQGFNGEDAAIWGVYIHALAADYAAEKGERGMIASDVLDYVRKLVG